MTAVADDTPLLFGDFELQQQRRQLLLGGEPLRLGGRAFDLLAALALAHPQSLTADALVLAAWGNKSVDKNNLRVQVASLRKALGGDVIRHLPGYGYRLELPVRRAGDAAGAERADDAPPLPGNLPDMQPELFARGDELAHIQQAMAQQVPRQTRLTIVGAPGIGKTALAMAAAQRLRPAYADGVFLVELAALDSGTLLPATAAQVLGLPGSKTQTSLGLAQALADRRLLLVLDNCEHLPSAAQALCDDLLRAAPAVHVLATSRKPLKSAGEQLLRLAPLALPADDSLAAARRSGAVALFEARARYADLRFAVTAANVAAVQRICKLLEGMPLALALAAARVTLWGVQGLSQQLAVSLGTLPAVGRDDDQRHATLHNAVQWSHALLSPLEQALLRLLGVFAGSFSLQAVQQLAAVRGLSETTVLKALAGLLDNSLLQADLGSLAGADARQAGGGMRYTMHAIVREFARGELAAGDDAPALHEAHALWCCSLLPDNLPGQPRPSKQATLPAADVDNVRAGIAWATQQALPLALDLCSRMVNHWRAKGQHDEALAAGLPLLTQPAPPALEPWRIRLRLRLCAIAYESEQPGLMLQLTDDTLAWPGLADYPIEAALAWSWVGCAHVLRDDKQATLDAFLLAVELGRGAGDPASFGEHLGNLGWALMSMERRDEARAVLAEAHAIVEASGNLFGIALSHMNLGSLAYEEERLETALRHFQAGVAGYRRAGMQMRAVLSLTLEALACARLGRLDAAMACVQEVLDSAMRQSLDGLLAEAYTVLASVLQQRGRRQQALTLVLAAERLFDGSQMQADPPMAREAARCRASAEAGLDAFGLHAARAAADVLDARQVLAWALPQGAAAQVQPG